MPADDRFEPHDCGGVVPPDPLGEEFRSALARGLISDWSKRGDLSESQVRDLAMWAAASARLLAGELALLRSMTVHAPERESE